MDRGKALAAAAGLALAVRVPLLPARVVVEGDGVHYASLARDVLAGDLSGLGNPYWSNLWPGLIALVSAASGLDVVAAGRAASLACGVLLVLAVTLLAERVAGPRAGLLAGLAAAAHPWLAHFATLVFTESAFGLLTTVGLWTGLRAAESLRPRAVVAAGLTLAAAVATRPEAFAATLVVAVAIGGAAWRRARFPSAAHTLLLLALPILLVLGLRAALVRYYYDEWDFMVGSKGTANLFIGMAETDAEKERVSSALDEQGRNRLAVDARTQGLLGFALRHPRVFAVHLARNTARLGQASAEVLPPLPVSLGAAGLPAAWRFAAGAGVAIGLGLAVIGAVALLRRPETHKAAAALAAVSILHALGLAATNVHPRLVVPLVPVFLVFFAAGLERAFRRRPAVALLAMLLAAPLTLVALRRAPSLAYADDPEVSRDAGRFVRERFGAETRLLTPVPAIAFYALTADHKDQEVDLPWLEPAALLDLLRRERVNVVAAPEWYLEAVKHPSAAALLAGTLTGLTPVTTFGAAPYRVFLYAVDAGAVEMPAAAP